MARGFFPAPSSAPSSPPISTFWFALLSSSVTKGISRPILLFHPVSSNINVHGKPARTILAAAIMLLALLPVPQLSLTVPASSTIDQASPSDFSNGTSVNVSVGSDGPNGTITLALTEIDSWWRQPAPAYPSARGFCRSATIFTDDKIMVFGGWNGGSHLDDTWVYDLSEGNWTQLSPPEKPSARDDYAMAPVSGTDLVVLFGGGDGLLNDTWIFNATQGMWFQQFPSESPPGRHNAAMAPVGGDDKLMLFGGSNWGGYFNDTWLYDVGENSWSRVVANVSPPARDLFAISWVPGDDKVVLHGGNNGWPYLNDTWIFDPTKEQWGQVNTTTAPVPGFGNVLCPVFGTGKLVLFGGYNLGNQTWFFNLSRGDWQPAATRGTIFGRTDYAMAPVAGTDRAILFGGYTGSFRDSTWMFNFSGYCAEGCFTSAPLDLGGAADLIALGWNASTPVGTAARCQLRSANSTAALGGTEFVGPDGTNASYYTESGLPAWSGHNGSTVAQYRLWLASAYPEQTPVVHNVTVDFNLHPLEPELLAPSGDGWANGSAVFSWRFVDNDSAAQGGFQLQVCDEPTFASAGYDSGNVSSPDQNAAAVLSQGDGYWRVRTQDAEGAWGPYSPPRAVRVDTMLPNVTIVAPGAGLLGQTDFTMFGTASDEGSGLVAVEARSDGGSWRPCNGTSNWRVDMNLSKGAHNLEVRAVDAANNTAVAAAAYNINRPPSVAINSPAEGSVYNMTDTIPLGADGSDVDGDSLTFIWKDGAVALGTGPALSAGFSAGDHTVTVTVSDGRGNEVVRSVNFTVYSALPVPSVRIIAPRENDVLGSANVLVNFSVSNFSISPTAGGPHLRYRLFGQTEQSWYSDSVFSLANVDNGAQSLSLWLVDASGRNLTNPESFATVNFTVNDPGRNLPDLGIAGQDISIKPERPRKGDEVSITFRVFNRGNQGASGFSVRLFVDGNETAERAFRGLDAGANSTGKLVWKAARGVHSLRLAVDPSNEISERNESNNEASVEVTVGAPGAVVAGGADWLLPITVVFLAVFAVAGAIVYARRRAGDRRRSGPAAAGPSGRGASAAAGASLKPLDAPFTIEDLFLIYRDGRLVQHASKRLTAGEDSSEIMASMLTAVQTFIQDALSRGQQAVLGSMEYSGRKILLEADRNLILAIVISGPEPDGLRSELVQALRNIESEFGPLLPGWDGDIVALSGTRRFLTALGNFRAEELSELELRMDARLPTDVKVMSEVEFYQGFARLRVAVRNEGNMLVADAALDLHFNEDILRLDRIEPAYPMSGKRVVLGNIGPKEKKTVAYYLDPQICTESAVDGVLTYRDAKGEFKTAPLKRRMVTVVCPILHTEENINTAMLRRMIGDELDQRDSKLFVVPEKLPIADAFALGKRSVEGHDVRFVREFSEKEPYKAEAWYFGKTKAREAKLVIRVCARGEGRTLEFFVASGSRLAVTGLLAELRSDLVKRQRESAPAFQRMEQVVDLSIKEKVDAERPLLEKYREGDETPDRK